MTVEDLERGGIATTETVTTDAARVTDAVLPGGTRIDRYELAGPLGAGGMGVVYAARDTELGRSVAIKLVRPQHQGLADAQARLRREAQVMAQLSHPNVVVVHDIGTFQDRLFIAMERLDAGTLRAWLEVRRPSIEVLAKFVQAGRGLAAAHAAGIVHRDFKPDNVLLGAQGQVRVADFGLARPSPELDAGEASTRPAPDVGPTITRTDAIVGTLAYMAPEQLFGQPVDARADQFAFGVALYEALERARPFPTSAELPPMAAQAMAVTSGQLRPWAVREVPPRMRRAIERSLQVDPEARWPSMEAMLAELAPPPRRAAWRIVIVSALAVATLVVAGIAWSVRERPDAARGTTPLSFQHTQQLTFGPQHYAPDLSPDGRYAAYGADRGVVIHDLSSNERRLVEDSDLTYALRWSPRGDELLAVTQRGAKRIPRDGGAPRLISIGARTGSTGTWSPDGSKLIWKTAGEPDWTIVDVATDGRASVTIALPAPGWVDSLDWSSADRLAMLTSYDGTHVVWTAKPDGSELTRVVDSAEKITTVRWNASGTRLYFDRLDARAYEIVRLDPRTGSREVVFSTPAIGLVTGGQTFAISADEQTLLYAPSQQVSDLVLQPLPSDTRRDLTADHQAKTGGAVSPSGRWIAFASGSPRAKRIYRIPSDGGAPVPIGDHTGDIRHVVWAPDETELAFSERRDGKLIVARMALATGHVTALPVESISDDGNLEWAPAQDLMVHRPDHRNYAVIDSVTGAERPLLRDDTEGWIFHAKRSPDGRSVAFLWSRGAGSGVWMMSLSTGHRTLLSTGRAHPIGWSTDGAWVYVHELMPGNTSGTRLLAVSASGDGTSRVLLTSEHPMAADARVLPGERGLVLLAIEYPTEVWMATTQPRAVVAPPPPAPPRAPDVLPAFHPAPINLALEGELGAPPTGWLAPSATIVDDCSRAGLRCAKLSTATPDELRLRFDASPYRGKRARLSLLARVQGAPGVIWVRTGVAWTRIDNARRAFSPSTWERQELIADIGPEAVYVELAIGIEGEGQLWIDDVTFERVDAKPAR